MMDLASVAAVLSTAIFAVTLFVFILQVRVETASIKHDIYQRCQSDYSALTRLFIENRKLEKVYDELGSSVASKWPKYTKDQKAMYHYLELNYELFERVFILSDKHWITEGEWKLWDGWLKAMALHKLFADVHNDNRGLFDPKFQRHVDSLLQNKSS
jgi:hypothetical protein